jgi:hypothetical protein
MISTNDINVVKRRLDDVGDPKNFQHFKAFGRHYGVPVLSAAFGTVLFFQALCPLLDFFSPSQKQGGNNNGRRDRR